MRVFCCTLLFLLSASAADWDRNQFPDWSHQTLQKLLTDSPWARPRTVGLEWVNSKEQQAEYKDIAGTNHNWPNVGGSPVGGIGARKSPLPGHADILIRWSSALPLRRATALYRQRDEKLESVSVNELVAPAEADYVLELFGLPLPMGHGGAGTLEVAAKNTAVLRLRSGRVIKPNRVEVKVQSNSLSVLIHFPRTEPIEKSDGDVECSVDLQIFSVKERFRLAPMVYEGKLEL